MSYYIGKTGVWMMTQTLAAIAGAAPDYQVNMVSPGVLEDSICDTPLDEMPDGAGTARTKDVLHPHSFSVGGEFRVCDRLQSSCRWRLEYCLGSVAPKGQSMLAQGNALGIVSPRTNPERTIYFWVVFSEFSAKLSILKMPSS